MKYPCYFWISQDHASGTPWRDDLVLAGRVMPHLKELSERA